MACSNLYHRCIYVMWNKKLGTSYLCNFWRQNHLFVPSDIHGPCIGSGSEDSCVWSSGSWHWQSGAWVNFWMCCSYKKNSISNFLCAWRKPKVFHKSLDCYHLNQTQTSTLCVQPVLGSDPCCSQPDYTVSYLWKQRSETRSTVMFNFWSVMRFHW